MKTIAEFTIDKLPAMTNKIGRSHWSAKHKERVIWQRLISEQCNFLRLCELHLPKAHLTLTRHSSRCPDSDGLVSGFKVVIDSLVRCGVLVDDKYTVIGMPTYQWEMRTRKQGGMVTIKIEIPE